MAGRPRHDIPPALRAEIGAEVLPSRKWGLLEPSRRYRGDPSALSVWLALRCNASLGDCSEALLVPMERLRAALMGHASLDAAEAIRADLWLSVAWLRHAVRCGEHIDQAEIADAVLAAQAVGCEVGVWARGVPE